MKGWDPMSVRRAADIEGRRYLRAVSGAGSAAKQFPRMRLSAKRLGSKVKRPSNLPVTGKEAAPEVIPARSESVSSA